MEVTLKEDKFKPGDRIKGLEAWEYDGIGTVIKRKDDGKVEAYLIRWDNSPDSLFQEPHAKYIRLFTKLEKALK